MPKTRATSSPIPLKSHRWTAEDAKQVLLELDQSGLSVYAFAVREGLSPHRLWRWRRELGIAAVTAFEEVVRHDTPSGPEGEATAVATRERFEIVLRSGRVVRVPAAFEPSALRQLLAIVDEVGPC